jgi:hypothetical protein
MALTIKRNGYGQVEPNHLSAQRTSQIYAQLPANKDIEILENGMFAKYDYARNEVNFNGEGEFMLVLNEVKLYDTNRETYKDFAMKKANYLNGEMVPRLFKTNVGDIYTTNMIDEIEVDVETKLTPNNKGILSTATGDEEMIWKVVKVYTLADGQDAVKVQRIK